LGSALYIGKWRKEAVKFLTTNEKLLAERQVWLFSSGPTGEGNPVELLNGWRVPKAQQPIIDRSQPRDVAVFYGNVDIKRLNQIEKWTLNNVKSPVGEYRSWEEISAWTAKIGRTLKETDQLYETAMNKGIRVNVSTLVKIFGIGETDQPWHFLDTTG